MRCRGAGGKVVDKRALGELIPSRSLGDMKTKLKCPGAIIATPDVTQHVLTTDDAWLVLASDGLWDDMKLDKVMEHLGKAKSADAAAQAIAKVRLGLVWDVACVSARVAPRASLLLQQTTVDDREGAVCGGG